MEQCRKWLNTGRISCLGYDIVGLVILSFTCMAHTLLCPYALQGVDDLSAWIVDDRTNLESKVSTRRMFGFFAKKELSQLLYEKTEVESYLEQSDGHIHSMEGDLELL